MIVFCRSVNQIIHREVKVIAEMKKYPPGSVIWEPHVDESSRFLRVSLRISLRSRQRRIANIEYTDNFTPPDASEEVIPNFAMVPRKYLWSVGNICNHSRGCLC